jgi:hypothetical protein
MKVEIYRTMSLHIFWTMFGYHVIKLKFFIPKNEFFQQRFIKHVENEKFDK